ncbi:MAG: hypothetical protein ACYC7A_20015 [Thermoanaerobaculia bacterium]
MHSLNRSFLALSLVFASLLIALASCAKKETTTSSETAAAVPVASAPADAASTAADAAPAPAPSVVVAPTGIATADGETAGVTATIRELKRASGGTISLKLVITNGSDKQLDIGYAFVDPDNSGRDFNSIGGVQLIDPVGKRKYFVARDAEKKCVCSQGIKGIKPGASVNLWAKFPAPPLDVQKISSTCRRSA